MTLLRNRESISTVFDLLGTNENDMTAGLAFALSESKNFLNEIVRIVACNKTLSLSEAAIKIQTSRRGEGITDIEIDGGPEFFAICEAKRGAELPTRRQLGLYAPVVSRHTATHRYLVTVSNATDELARVHYPKPTIGGISLKHLSWRAVRTAAIRSVHGESNANKQLLRQFINYLSGLLKMETRFSNLVYVVSLAKGNPPGWKISWIDIVEERNTYFYPIGSGGWPDPPNYLGFRYDGKLQSIRRVESCDTNLVPREVFPEAARGKWVPHYILKLGPAILPTREIRNGPNILRAMRCWCMIDTLLTCNTISEALAETKKRQAEAQN